MPAVIKKYKDGELVSEETISTVKKPRKNNNRKGTFNAKSNSKDAEKLEEKTTDS